MQVVDHEPHFWFLFKEADALFLDANCNNGPVGYSIMIQLKPEEAAEYSRQGRTFLNWLAQAIQDSGPRRGYQLRDLSATYAEQSMAAVHEWRAAEGGR